MSTETNSEQSTDEEIQQSSEQSTDEEVQQEGNTEESISSAELRCGISLSEDEPDEKEESPSEP